MTTSSPSIHELNPIETGGSDARLGFAVQDHVAASHCLDMLENPDLGQVWCESQDDVTLIWVNSGPEEVEFVQVKSNELDQLWSISKLTSAERGTDGTVKKCILEKSLQYDRVKEPVRFRIVTCRPVMDELKLLSYARSSPLRAKSTDEFVALAAEVAKKLAHIRSENGNGCEFWIERTLWECIHSLESIRNKNLLRIARLVEKQGQFLATDHIAELYARLLTKVYDGGSAKWNVDAKQKKILRNELMVWFSDAVNKAVHPGQITAGKTLEAKLTEAKIPADQFEAIAEMRMRYRLEGLPPKYTESASIKKLLSLTQLMENTSKIGSTFLERNPNQFPLSKSGSIEGAISARLMMLRAQLDGGVLENNGALFHATCLAAITDIVSALAEADRPPLQNLFGYMYNLADRCTHRFVRAKT